MTKVKTVEFWLLAIPALLVLAWVADVNREPLPVFLGVWVLLAIYWMFRELMRRFFN
jgi:hypothetical protein